MDALRYRTLFAMPSFGEMALRYESSQAADREAADAAAAAAAAKEAEEARLASDLYPLPGAKEAMIRSAACHGRDVARKAAHVRQAAEDLACTMAEYDKFYESHKKVVNTSEGDDTMATIVAQSAKLRTYADALAAMEKNAKGIQVAALAISMIQKDSWYGKFLKFTRPYNDVYEAEAESKDSTTAADAMRKVLGKASGEPLEGNLAVSTFKRIMAKTPDDAREAVDGAIGDVDMELLMSMPAVILPARDWEKIVKSVFTYGGDGDVPAVKVLSAYGCAKKMSSGGITALLWASLAGAHDLDSEGIVTFEDMAKIAMELEVSAKDFALSTFTLAATWAIAPKGDYDLLGSLIDVRRYAFMLDRIWDEFDAYASNTCTRPDEAWSYLLLDPAEISV